MYVYVESLGNGKNVVVESWARRKKKLSHTRAYGQQCLPPAPVNKTATRPRQPNGNAERTRPIEGKKMTK